MKSALYGEVMMPFGKYLSTRYAFEQEGTVDI